MNRKPCDLCGCDWPEDTYSEAAWEASGLDICPDCLEAMLNASTDNARAEVGMVGGFH